MQELFVEGGNRLCGELTIQGSKNGVLPVLAATILCAGACRIENCPRLRDVDASIAILRHLGCCTRWEDGALIVDTTHMDRGEVPDALMREMRSSVIFLGAILARQGEAALSYPGGCELGPRPVDMHLDALRRLGAEIREDDGRLIARARAMTSAEITLRFPSVGATENAMIAACGAEGVTVIRGAAREPEIRDLAAFLEKTGARVRGAGSGTVTVAAADRPCTAVRHRVIGDRIAAGTWLCAAAATGGRVRVLGTEPAHLASLCGVLTQAGCTVRGEADGVLLEAPARLRAPQPVVTQPYPGFPTDLQAPLMAALLRAAGESVFTETIFRSRYRHVPELAKLGADIVCEGDRAVVRGVERLHGAAMTATDLRGGAAMLIAALAAEEKSTVAMAEHIDRGYENVEEAFGQLGVRLYRA